MGSLVGYVFIQAVQAMIETTASPATGDGSGRDDRGDEGVELRLDRRAHHLPRAGPSIDDGHLGGPHREEQWPALFKIDPGATVQALMQSKPDGIYSALFSRDLTAFVREAKLRGLLTDDLTVVGLLTGEPEYLDPMGAEAPEGWIVTGYPWYDITDPEHGAIAVLPERRGGPGAARIRDRAGPSIHMGPGWAAPPSAASP